MQIRFYAPLLFIFSIILQSLPITSKKYGDHLFTKVLNRPDSYEKSTSDPLSDSKRLITERGLQDQEPNTLNENQYLSMIADLTLSGTWSSVDDTIQQGDFFTKDYGYMVFEGDLLSDYSDYYYSKIYHQVTLKIYDGHIVDDKHIAVRFYCEDLKFNSLNASFYGNIVAQEFTTYQERIPDDSDTSNSADYVTNCSAFIQLSFINIATNSPLYHAPDYGFANAGIQATISQSNCPISIISNTLINEPLSTGDLTFYAWVMSVLLGIGTISGMFILCSFPENASKLRTVGITGILFASSWQLFVIFLYFLSQEFGMAVPSIISFINIFLLIFMNRCARLVTFRDRSRRKTFEDRWWWMTIIFCLGAVYSVASLFPVFSWSLLLSCLCLGPQFREKRQRGNRAEVYWMFNLTFIAPQMLFVSYLLFYGDNVFGFEVNIPLGVIYIVAICTQFAVLALWKWRPAVVQVGQERSE